MRWPKRFALAREERRALITMLWLVPALHAGVRIADYRRTRAWLERRSPPPAASGPDSIVEAYRLATTRVAAYSWLPGNCLSRSLSLWVLLRRRGFEPELHLGASLSDGQFSAHAWVELHGRVLNDRQDVGTRFARFSTPPERRAFD